MDASFDTWQLIALAGALGWASGVRLYAVLFIVGGLGFLGWIPLPGKLDLLAHPYVLAASGAMFAIEFFADCLGASASVGGGEKAGAEAERPGAARRNEVAGDRGERRGEIAVAAERAGDSPDEPRPIQDSL